MKNHLLTLEIIALLRGEPLKRVFDDSFKGVKLSDKRFKSVLSMITTNNISAVQGANLKAKFERLIFYNIL